MPQLERQQSVLELLKNLRGLDPLKQLFWSELNYQRVNTPLSRRGWTESAKQALADDPVLFAGGGENNDFHVIYGRLASDRLLLGQERPVVSRLVKEHPYALFVFSNKAQDRWHFLNVKYDDTAEKRRLFRRITVGPEERLRTASERISLLNLEAISPDLFGVSPLMVQQHHDEAFDVEAVTKQFFADFSDMFIRVARDIKERNRSLDDDAVEQETQTLLNRLLFLYFVQRKGWLNRQRDYLYENFRQHYAKDANGTTYYSEFLLRLFVKLSTEGEHLELLGDLPFLNGGLFDDELGHQSTETLRRTRMKVGNAVFRRVFDDLLERYNFTVREDTPLDQDVAIDPEMLGKIFESLVLQLEQSDTGGKTSRHDTGSYYTPRPIVHYLCREGLRAWLEQSPPTAVRRGSPDPANELTEGLRAGTGRPAVEESARSGDRRTTGKENDWPKRLEKLLALDASDGIQPEEQAILDECLSPEEAQMLLDRLDDFRACDPAVGSGAFPVGLLHEVVNLRRLCETRARGKDPVAGDSEWLFYTKSQIIQRVLYGVDIQERAIEICKLRLWLSLMVDHPLEADVDNCSESAFRKALKHLPALPNLDYKIRRANSLIDQVRGHPVNLDRIAAEDTKLPPILNKLTSAKRAFYEAHTAAEKRRAKFDILDATADLGLLEFKRSKLDVKDALVPDEASVARLRELDAAVTELLALQSQIRAARRKPAAHQDEELERLSRKFDDPDKPTFVWQLDFAEIFHRQTGNGFDMVLANPPYVDSETMTRNDPNGREVLVGLFRAARGNWDLFVVFVERALSLLSTGGVMSYIVPNKIIGAPYAESIRQVLAENRIRELRDYSRVNVFAEAAVYPVTVVAQRVSDKSSIKMTVMKSVEEIESAKLISADVFHRDTNWSRYFESADSLAILEKCSAHSPLRKFFPEITGAATVSEAYEIKDIIAEYNGREKKPFKKFINTGTLDPYSILWGLKTTRYIKDGYEKPIVFDEDIADLNLKRLKQAHAAKIIIGGMTLALECAYDEGEVLAGKSTTIVLESGKLNLKYALGILNSRLITFWYRTSFKALTLAGGYLRINSNEIGSIPVALAGKPDQDAIVSLVDKILSAKRKNPAADVTALEREIDERVYRLYGLTKEEIKLVEAGKEEG